jgi:hypothetical protein
VKFDCSSFGLIVLVTLVACATPRRPAPRECSTNADCETMLGAGATCSLAGRCVAADAGTLDLGGVDLGGMDLGTFDAGNTDDAGADDAGVHFDLGVDLGQPDLGVDMGRPDLGVDMGRPDLGVDFGTPLGARLVISEFASGGPAGADDEFIEIYNAGGVAYDASGLRIEYRSASGAAYTLVEALAPGTIIGARRFYLVGGSTYSGVAVPDVPFAFTSVLSGTGGHVRLIATGGAELDRCGYGTAVEPEGTPAAGGLTGTQSRERKAFATSTPTSMAVGGIDAFSGNGRDSGDNGADFIVREIAEPQNSSSIEP